MKTISIIIIALFIFSFSKAQKVSNFEKPWFENKKVTKAVSYNQLMDNYDVKFYYIDLNITNQSKAISGFGTIKAEVINSPFNEIVVQLHSSLSVDSVLVNGESLAFNHSNNEISVNLSASLSEGEIFDITVFYYGTSSGSGISSGTSPSWGKRATWTLSESYHGMDWYPCKQDLNDKADSAWIFLTCDTTLKAGAPGILTDIVKIDGTNKHRFEWKTYYPIVYYLLSLAVSDYQEYNIWAHPAGITDSVLIQNYVYSNANYLNNTKVHIDRTVDFLEILSDWWGIYPFWEEKYGHCTAPFSGGMEHQTMTSLGYFNFELVVHELAHQWFGDYVTCATWQDIFVNEGFATYSYYQTVQVLENQTEADDIMINYHQTIMGEPGGSIWVPFSDIMNESRIFDYRLTYLKGAAVLHTIRYIINNDSIFNLVYRTYLDAHAFGTATIEDFRQSLEEISQIDFETFFEQWIYGEGYPTYSINGGLDDNTINFTLTQTTSMPNITAFFDTPLDIKFVFATGDTIIRFYPSQNIENYSIELNAPTIDIIIDPNNGIINKVNNIVLNNHKNNYNPIFIIYPNPVNDVLYWLGDLNPTKYTVFDITGKAVLTGIINSSDKNINLSGIKKGVYHLNLHSDTENYSVKFIKQ